MNLKFCLRCASPLTMLTATEYRCAKGHSYYNNPSPAVAVIFQEGTQLLFSKRAMEPNKGSYDFPGGFIEYGEDARAACVREIQEETSVHIDKADLHLLATYTDSYLPDETVLDIVFLAKKWRGSFEPADDSAALEWKPMEFINDPDFVPDYQGLIKLLKNRLANSVS